MSTHVLVIGQSGQVAQALARAPRPDGWTLTCIGRDRFDFSSAAALNKLLATRRASVVINAAAYTAVDKAESEVEAAYALNRDAPKALAQACAAARLPFVHISTDYVFDGKKPSPYLEDDPIAPASVYGASKAEGERAVRESGADAAILRTSWVYAATGANFVKTMLRLAESRDEISVVSDQHGRPTWAADLADACLIAAQKLIAGEQSAHGLFHYAGGGDATWADLAEAVFAESRARGGPSAVVKRITTAEYPTPARRPANSRLDTHKIENILDIHPRPWRDALRRCMDDILS